MGEVDVATFLAESASSKERVGKGIYSDELSGHPTIKQERLVSKGRTGVRKGVLTSGNLEATGIKSGSKATYADKARIQPGSSSSHSFE